MDYLGKITKWLGYFIASLVIIAATLVSAGRLLTPYLNQHKSDFEHWASELLDVPVQIQQVHISWHGYVPQLTLDQVAILDIETHKPTFDIHQIKISIKIFETLIKRQPILSYVHISGMDLTVRSKQSGALNIVGFGDITVTDDLFGGIHEANEIVSWILSQPALVLTDINVTFFTPAGVEKSITLDELSLSNSGQKHFLSGKGSLNQDISTNVEIALHWQGESFDFEHMTANLYLYVEGISLPQWLKELSWKNLQIREGLGSAKIWVVLDKGQLQKIQTQLQLYELTVYSMLNHQTQIISRLNGHFGWKRDGDHQVIAGDDILIDLPQHLWPTTSFSLTLPFPYPYSNTTAPPMLPHEDHILFRVSYVDLADLYSIAIFTGLLPEALENKLFSIKPQGEMTGFDIDFGDNVNLENNALKANFSELSWNAWENYPGIHGLSGELQWDRKNGYLILNTKDLKVHDTTFFTAPVALEKLMGQIQFQKDKNNDWLLHGSNLTLVNDDLLINANIAIQMPKGGTPYVNLLSYVNVKNAAQLIHYLPLKKADPELARWLGQAFHKGSFEQGKIILRGKLSDFPFNNQNGQFELHAEAKDIDLHFAPGWPMLTNTDGTLQFIGRQMVVDVKSANLLDIPLQNIHGEIPYIGPQQPPLLLLHGVIKSNLVQGLQLIKQSPLKNKASNVLNTLQLAGPMQLALNLSIPMKKPEQSIVVGDMAIKQSTLSVPAWNIVMDNLTGTVRFTEKSLVADSLIGTLWKEPVILQINTEQKDKNSSYITVKMQGKLTNTVLKSFLQNGPYRKIIQGETSYAATLRLFPEGVSQASQLTIDTDLKGITLDLPVGLGKKANDIIPSKIMLDIQYGTPLSIKWVYGNKLTATTVLDDAKKHYLVKVESSGIAGTMIVPINVHESAIQANFSRLYLVPLAADGAMLDPRTLPAIHFVGDDVRYQDKRLGKVSFDMAPVANGVDITSLRLSSNVFTLNAGGTWTVENKKHQTELSGKLLTKNVANFLSNWSAPTANPADTAGSVAFELAWPDAPYRPLLAGLSGTVDLALGAGRIVNLDESTNAKMGFGRLLNLLSLESISRALTLNFSDLTKKGYNFDFIKGNFTFKNGNAYAENVQMKGSVADIEMSGRIGLTARDYNLKLRVTPFVTGSIPIVAALAVNPIVGIGAWFVEKVAGKAVSSATARRYQVTGTWDKPVWVEK